MKIINLFKEEGFDVKLVLLSLLRGTPTKGFTVGDVRIAVRLADILEEVEGDKLELEDKDYELLKKIVQHTRFTRASPQLVKLLDELGL